MGKRLKVMAKGTNAFGPAFTLNEVDREGERGKLVGVHPVAACEHEQYAHRLAACWNACEGVSTCALETICFSLPASYDAACEERDQYRRESEKAGYQRDTLAMAIGKAAELAGIAGAGEPMNVPALLQLLDDIAADHKRITIQRDALLEALEAAVTHHDDFFKSSTGHTELPWVAPARAAMFLATTKYLVLTQQSVGRAKRDGSGDEQ